MLKLHASEKVEVLRAERSNMNGPDAFSKVVNKLIK